jgi:predicted acylesterase/phospholipase RssA
MNVGTTAYSGDEKKQASPQRPEPLDATDPPPDDRYCDLVLTGGVTDGVIYPWAVMELARKYRFNNIGGTSVGAMAAALTAAAEYGRRYGSLTGFNEVLLKLPEKLGEKEPITSETKLFSLFQPDKTTWRLFDLFVSAFSTKPSPRKWGTFRTVAGAVIKSYRRQAVWGGILGLLLAVLYRLDAIVALPPWSLDTIAWWCVAGDLLLAAGLTLFLALPLALVCGLVLIGLGIYCDLLHGLVPNGFGLCTGCHKDTLATRPQTLIEWLHEGIQAAAGKPLDQPLTFKDLWDAPGGPVGRPLPPARQTRKARSIDLQMVTTNLTHGRPYDLPLGDKTSRLFFKRSELEPYFPAAVLDYLEERSIPYAPMSMRADPAESPEREKLRELPYAELPIVVAARLSLSFPFLFSAVPLWAIDYEPRLKEDRTLRKCWFSDGGICSNFPIHLFDAAIPQWPTFGIWLGPRSIFRSNEFTWLPKFHFQGRGDSWDRFGDERLPLTGETVSPLCRLFGFVRSIVWTAKDWNDKTSMRMPGVRDRVIHVALDNEEGGLNLKLTYDDILKLASKYGLPAGKALVNKFIDPAPGNPPSRAWNEHRWVRFNTLLVALRERIEGITEAAELTPYAKPLSAQISEAQLARPLAGHDVDGERLTAAQVDALVKLLAALKDLESKFAQAATPQPYKPLPTPTIHIRSPL